MGPAKPPIRHRRRHMHCFASPFRSLQKWLHNNDEKSVTTLITHVTKREK